MKEERPNKITVRLTDDEWKIVEEKRSRQRTKFQHVGLNLLMAWARSSSTLWSPAADEATEDDDDSTFPPHTMDERTAVTEFLRRYRAGENPLTTDLDVPDTTPEERHWIEKLLYILRSEDEQAIHAVQSNIVVFERTVALTKGTQRKKLKLTKVRENNA